MLKRLFSFFSIPPSLFLFLIFFTSPAGALSPLVIMTENYPPYNYLEQKTLKGPCVEIINSIMNDLHIESEIKILPWARAYFNIKEVDNQVLFSMARNASREDLFKWVGPLVKYDVFLYKKKGAPILIRSLEDSKKYKVGVKKDTAGHTFVKDNGFNKIIVDYTSSKFPLPRMLVEERIDLWLMGEISAPYMMKLAGVEPGTIEPAFNVYTQELYIAFSKSTPDGIIIRWQNALNRLKASGEYAVIMEKYKLH